MFPSRHPNGSPVCFTTDEFGSYDHSQRCAVFGKWRFGIVFVQATDHNPSRSDKMASRETASNSDISSEQNTSLILVVSMVLLTSLSPPLLESFFTAVSKK
jgi:hypothetical protein